MSQETQTGTFSFDEWPLVAEETLPRCRARADAETMSLFDRSRASLLTFSRLLVSIGVSVPSIHLP